MLIYKDKDKDKNKDKTYDFWVSMTALKVLASDNQKYIDKIIEDNDFREKTYELSPTDMAYIIAEKKDLEYIKALVKDNTRMHNFKFSYNDLFILLKPIFEKDVSFIKNLINDENMIKQLNLTSANVTNLIVETEDIEYVKSFTSNSESIKKYNFDIVDVINLIGNTDDEYIKSFIENPLKVQNLGILYNIREYLLLYIKDIPYLKSFLDYNVARKYIKLSTETEIALLMSTKDRKYINKNIKEAIKHLDGSESQKFEKEIHLLYKKPEFNRSIDLPENMTFGIEIESEGDNTRIIKTIPGIVLDNWKAVFDVSIGEGVEVISPILTKSTANSSKSIQQMCKRLINLGHYPTSRCGGHVHIGADYLTMPESYKNLAEIWGNAEDLIYIISNSAGEIPRPNVIKYAKPISKDLRNYIGSETITLNDPKDLADTIKKSQNSNRYYGINFQNIGSYKNTIEFRVSNGTLDSNTWIENINLFGGIIKAAEDLSLIQKKEESLRTQEENEKIKNFEKIKNKNISKADKASALINLVIPENNRYIYNTRYYANSKLMSNEYKLLSKIKDNISDLSININNDVQENSDKSVDIDYNQMEEFER